MKMAFIIHPKGIEPGPKLDHILERVRFALLNRHDIQILHAEPKLAGIEPNQFFVDEVSRG